MFYYIRKFIARESTGGLMLLAAAIVGCVISNSELYDTYLYIVNLPIKIGAGAYNLEKPLIKWVNDGLMSMFFLMLGLEMKYHMREGEFQSLDKILLSLIAAVGGALVPAILFLSVNYNNPETINGWAVPVAFDSAFTFAILSFFPKKISIQARIFVVGLALVDDAFAITILAVFYTSGFKLLPFLFAIIFLLLLILCNRIKVKYLSVYLVLGALMWIATVEAGIHGTIAGILLAFTIPIRVENKTLVKNLEHVIHPIVTYMILPIFAFLNSEIPFSEINISNITSNLTVGIMLGLVVGKPLGILLFSAVAIQLKVASLPSNTYVRTFIAISVLNGIGFTLSLFIGMLSFDSQVLINQMRIGVIFSSLIAATLGVFILINCRTIQYGQDTKGDDDKTAKADS